jgi:hypothetical protein
MAIHTDLSIHKSCCDLLGVSMEATKHMPRDFKSSLGADIRKLCISMILSVMRANKTLNESKVTHIDQVLEDVEVFNDLFRVCRDMHMVSTKLYAKATEITGSIGRQAGGWRKKSASSPVASPSRR